jgi:hypothetical protein
MVLPGDHLPTRGSACGADVQHQPADDYHTAGDIPERIDYPKLTRMAQWMYLTGWYVANAARRPAVDAGFKLER